MGFPSTPYLLTSSLWAYLSPFLLSYCPWAYYFYLWTPLGPLASFEAYFLFSRLMIYYSCRSGLMVFFLPIYLLFSTHIVQLLLAIGLFCRNENQHFINTIIKVYLDTAYCWKHCNKIIFKWVNSAVGPNFKVDFARFRTCWSCEQCETYRNETQMCNAGKKRYPNSHLMYCIVVCRGVHESGRVGFMPDPDSSRNFWVGENGTRNQLRMLVGSGGLGLVGFRVVLSGFGLYRQWCYLAKSVEIWPDHDKISPDLANLMGFQVIFAWELQMPLIFVSFHWKSFEYHQRFLVLWLGRVARVLGEEIRQPTWRCQVLWATTRNQRRSGRFGRFPG